VVNEVVPAQPPGCSSELRVDGLSLVFYDFYVVGEGLSGVAHAHAPYHEVRSAQDYALIFDDIQGKHETLAYDRDLVLGPLDMPYAGKANGRARLLFKLVADRFLLAITVINVDRRRIALESSTVEAERSLRVDDILTIIADVRGPRGRLSSTLKLQRDAAVAACFGEFVVPQNAAQSTKVVGIQVWDVASIGEIPATGVNGVELANRYAWELAALLECNSDHIGVHHSWRERRADQVACLLGHGTDVLADHRVLTDRSVCVEISQVDYPSLTPRSAERLRTFGYDSTSLHLWHYLALQELTLGYFNSLLSEALGRANQLVRAETQEKGGHPAASESVRQLLSELVGVKTSLFKVMDEVCWITAHLKERRHAEFLMESVREWNLHLSIEEVERKLAELTSVSADVYQVMLAADQRDLTQDMRRLNILSMSTNRGIVLLNILAAAEIATVLALFTAQLVPALKPPLALGAFGLGLFVLFTTLILSLERTDKGSLAGSEGGSDDG